MRETPRMGMIARLFSTGPGFVGRRIAAVAALASAAASPADAQAPLPVARLDSIFPAGARAGGETTVEISGDFLDGPKTMWFSDPGIEAEWVAPEVDEFGVPVAADSQRFVVRVSENVRPGRHAVRVGGAFGVSNSRIFEIGRLAEVVAAGSIGSRESAMAVTPGTVVNARADDNAIDWFRLDGVGGRRVRLDLRADVLDSRMVPALEVIDGEGRTLAVGRFDGGTRDVAAEVEAEAGETLWIKVFDELFEGGRDFVYRLEVLAEGGDDGGDPLSAEAGAGSFRPVVEWTGTETGGAPVVGEAEPNATFAGEGAVIPVPVVVDGRFEAPRDVDRFRFEARKGETLVAEVRAERLGQRVDAWLQAYRLTPAEGGGFHEARLGENDDGPFGVPVRRITSGSRDPVFVITPDADGWFGIDLRNHLAAEGVAPAYRLVIRRPVPSFDLFVTAEPGFQEGKKIESWVPFVRRGGTASLTVASVVRDGFDGVIRLEVGGLPEGISVDPAWLAPGQREATLVMHHGPDTLPGGWSGPVTVTGIAEVGGSEVRREAVPVEVTVPVGDWDQERVSARRSPPMVVSVAASEPDPVRLEWKSPPGERLEATLGATIEIPFIVHFGEGVKDKVRVIAEGVAGMSKPPQVEVTRESPEGTLSLELKPTNENKFAEGESPLRLRAEGIIAYRVSPAAETHWNEEKARLDGIVGSLEAEVAEAEKAAGAAPEDAELGPRRDALKARLERARQSRQRLDGLAQAAAERAKPADRKAVAWSPATRLVIAPAPPPGGETPATGS